MAMANLLQVGHREDCDDVENQGKVSHREEVIEFYIFHGKYCRIHIW